VKKLAIIGGETHIEEVMKLGDAINVVGVAVRDDQIAKAGDEFDCPVTTDYKELIAQDGLDIVAVANENDRKAEVVLAALNRGCDVIVDKPLAITMEEQDQIEAELSRNADRRLLMLLTLRGNSIWAGMRNVVNSGKIGIPAFTHIRMAVRLKREQRPPWFLDVRRSGGLFLDLLIHGLDQVEWLTGRRIVAMTANTGNLGYVDEEHLSDHAAVYCELDDGSSAIVEGQRMLPDTKGSDYRVTVAGTKGYADLLAADNRLIVTSPETADQDMENLPEQVSVVKDWIGGGQLVPQAASLRANRLAILATMSAEQHERISVIV